MLSSPEPALARWFAHGVTSLTHPVLHHALIAFFHPLGIEAESLEAEPFSAIESGLGEFWLRRPRWNACRFDVAHRAFEDFAPLLARPESFLVAVDSRGTLQLSLDSAAGEHGPSRFFLEEGDQGWGAIRHSVRAGARAEAFIFAAAGLLCANDPIAEIYERGDDGGYCEAVAARIPAIVE